MTKTGRYPLSPILAGAAALAALAALNVLAGPRLGIDEHETLLSLARRLALWLVAGGLSFAALRPLRPITGTGR